ncbi:integrating conjugative element protein%2C PFL_4695 family [Salmonella enterica subsp. enterica serovar Typhi]|nr:integrating conjugative element protein%2C PFL_4695 family [Salmonella enterica subsp. enterica serovar Typhi]
MLPVTTPEMRAGKVEARELNLNGMTPVFLVGDDSLSRECKDALSELQQIIPDVILLPASASEIARRLHLNHYPVLITATGLAQ